MRSASMRSSAFSSNHRARTHLLSRNHLGSPLTFEPTQRLGQVGFAQSPAEKKSNDSKGLHSSPSAASMDSKADQRRLTVKALGSRGLPTLKLPNQRCQAQRCEIADFLFGRALRRTKWVRGGRASARKLSGARG